MGLPVVTSSKRMIFLLPTTVRYQEAFQERGMAWKSFHVGVVFWQTQVKTLSKTSIYWLSDIKHATCVGHRRDHDGNSHVTSRRQHPTAYLLVSALTFFPHFPRCSLSLAGQGPLREHFWAEHRVSYFQCYDQLCLSTDSCHLKKEVLLNRYLDINISI